MGIQSDPRRSAHESEPPSGTPPPSGPAPLTILFRAAAAVDAAGFCAIPGALLLRLDSPAGLRLPDRPPPRLAAAPSPDGKLGPWSTIRLLAAGTPADVHTHPAAADALVVDRPADVLFPALANAHTHLDLTHLGPRPFDAAGGFPGWIDMVRAGRRADPAAIAASVRDGVEKSLAGGVVAVGDIAGAVGGVASLAAVEPFLESPLLGVSFLEFFAIGPRADRRLLAAEQALVAALALRRGRAGVGLQPHAPYSVAPDAYRAAAALADHLAVPACTHLAESAAERQLVASGAGPFRALLEGLGAWEPALDLLFSQGRSPVEHLLRTAADPRTARPPVRFAVHLNDVSDADIALLAGSGVGVVVCPRASRYFQAAATFGPHRHQALMDAGVAVAIGTDSIVNLDTPSRITPWDDIRLLSQEDGAVGARTGGVDPLALAAGVTTTPAEFLGLRPAGFTFTPGELLAGLTTVASPVSPRPNQDARGVINALLGGSGVPNLVLLGSN